MQHFFSLFLKKALGTTLTCPMRLFLGRSSLPRFKKEGFSVPLCFFPKKSPCPTPHFICTLFSLEAQLSACLLHRHHTLFCMCIWNCRFLVHRAGPYRPLINSILVKDDVIKICDLIQRNLSVQGMQGLLSPPTISWLAVG